MLSICKSLWVRDARGWWNVDFAYTVTKNISTEVGYPPPPLPPINRVCFSHTSMFFLEGWGITWGGMVTTHCHMHNLLPGPPCKPIITISRCSNWTEVQLSIEFPIDKISYWQSHFLVVATSSLPCSKLLLTHNCNIMLPPRGWQNVEFTYTVTKKIKAPVLNPPKSGMFFPPSLEGTISYWKPSPLNVLYHWQWQSTMMVGSLHQWHLLPHSIVLPGSSCSSSLLTGTVPCQPPMHLMLTLSLPSEHRTQETSLNATHVRTCTRPSSSTHSSSRLSLTAQFLSYRHYRYSILYDLCFIFAVAYPKLQQDMQMGPKQGSI